MARSGFRFRSGPARVGALASLGLLVLFCAEPREPSPPVPAGPPPNVLVIVIDALRADRLGVAGYPLPTTPNIDRLAAEGVYFENATAHSTWTKPSIATLVTSLYPSQHGIQRAAVGPEEALRTERLDERLVTLAERFRFAGYATGAVLNQVHLLERFGFGQGYDFYKDVRGKNAVKLQQLMNEWLGTVGESPFLGYLHLLDVHWPYLTRKADLDEDLFGPIEMATEPPVKFDRAGVWASERASDDDFRALEARYDHEVAFVDAAIGRVIDRLRHLGLYENSVIVVTADHGDGFFEHGHLGHGFSPWDEVLRVPLVVRLPESMRRVTGVIAEPVGLIDVMPTLLELAGLEPEPQAEGISFAPLLWGDASPGSRVLFSETHDAFAARTATQKLIWFEDGRKLLFDLAADPTEQRPLPCAGECRELARQLTAFRRLMLDSRESSSTGTAVLEPEEIEELRALGYLD